MKKTFTFLLFFTLSITCLSQTWQQLSNFPGWKRDDGTSFTIGNNVYCGTGTVGGVGPMSDFYRFNALNDTWSTYTVTSLPVTGRQYCSAFSYYQYGFVVGGIDANSKVSNLLLKYDTVSNVWTQKNPMPDSVYGSVCFFINNKAYICGGRRSNNKCTNKVWQYDPASDLWTQKNNMPEGGRWRASGAVIFNKGYLIFGSDSANKLSNKVFEYNPVLDSWTLTDSFPGNGRNYASAFNANNQLIIALGIDSANTVYNDCYGYDVTSHLWINKTPLPSYGRKGCMAFTFNNNIYLTTGIDGSNNRLNETWKAGNLNVIENLDRKEIEIVVYPNPANDYIKVCSLIQMNTVSIYNTIGECVSLTSSKPTHFDKLSAGTNPCREGNVIAFDLHRLQNGIYFIHVKTDIGTATQKIIVQR
jgi:N-acetylneuraminic acid mutarotase